MEYLSKLDLIVWSLEMFMMIVWAVAHLIPAIKVSICCCTVISLFAFKAFFNEGLDKRLAVEFYLLLGILIP